MKRILPEPKPHPYPSLRGGDARREKDAQTIFPFKAKPQQVKDHEERKR